MVAPIRSRMAPKSGKERASSTIRAMTDSLKTTLVRLNSATQQGSRLTSLKKKQTGGGLT